ncbi:MAG: hypothetical protein KGV44_08020 [Flavobacteriaceae bacterium]|nr:hypothetical protein [Flavobacteriaceae bacterium]
MSLDITIPYISSVQSKFLINFKEVNYEDISSIPIVDVSIVLVESKNEILPLKDLISIGRLIRDYLINNQVVLYYYCDTSSDNIEISERNKELEPQEFRHKLFNSLYKLFDNKDIVKDEIIIEDPTNNTHFISLITKTSDKTNLTNVSIAVQQMNDK